MDYVKFIMQFEIFLNYGAINFVIFVDNIEDNVTKAADHVEEGNTQLTKASEYQVKKLKFTGKNVKQTY